MIALIIVLSLVWWNARAHPKAVKDHMQLYDIARTHSRHPLEIKANSIELQDVIGEGAFGVVHKGYLKSSHQYVAVKMLRGKLFSIKIIAESTFQQLTIKSLAIFPSSQMFQR